MPGKWPWFDRKFTFDFPPEKMPDIIERLRGTPARAEELVAGLAPAMLTRREGRTWSIQQNVGHLGDVEPLWMGRFDDMLAGLDTMREADLTNTKTFEADHNDRSLLDVCQYTRALRRELVARVEDMDSAQIAASAVHPRTRVRMRIIDLCKFVADHDDYHLSRITELKRQFAD